MKELSIEEKAKAYDKAIEELRGLLEGVHEEKCEIMEEDITNIFPELKESEDEKIRKRIISALVEWNEKCSFPGDSDDMIVWLEKQSESDETKAKNFLINKGYPIDANGTFPTYEEMYDIIKEGLEKQGEQKPQGKSALEAINEEKVDNANKVEQKFEAGDVLNSPSHHLIWIYRDNEHYYACVNMNYVTKNVAIGGLIKIPSDACHATKDERTILFKNLKKFGYEWDKEKKQLKKRVIHKKLTEFEKAVKQVMEEAIECGDTRNLKADAEMLLSLVQKPADKVEPKFKVGDTMRTLQEAADGFIDGMPVVVSIDEEYYHCNNELIAIKDQDSYEYPPMNRIQKPAWSEEDEKMFLGIESLIHSYRTGSYEYELSSWFESLKDRVQPQNGYNPYKEVVESIAEMCKHYDKASHSGLRDFYDNVKVKCKDAKEYDSLYPQTTWKPSDEQIEALDFAADCIVPAEFNFKRKELKGLLEQLKKLRKE